VSQPAFHDDRVIHEGVELIERRAAAYALAHTTPPSPEVAALRAETERTMPRPQLSAGLVEARLLEALVVATRATRVLDVGTFTGASALSVASRLPPGGKVLTLEADASAAAIARRHFDASDHRDRIELVVGDARESIRQVEGPFELVFIDAWKRDYAAYYEAVLPKLADNGLIVADNVLWRGLVFDPPPDDGEAIAVAHFADLVQRDERVDNALLTVGDGLLLVWKRRP